MTVYLAVALLGYAFGSFFLSFAWTDISYFLMAMIAGTWICVNERLARERLGPGSLVTDSTSVSTRSRRSGWRAARTIGAVAHGPALGGS